MKAATGELPPPAEAHAWSYEIKWDGMRVIACMAGTRAQLWSANHVDVTRRFPELEGVASSMHGRPAVLDGEVVAFDAKGLPSFGVLQTRMHVDDTGDARRRAALVPLSYAVFDVMHFDGHDLVPLALEQRVRVLDDVFEPAPSWRRVERHDDGRALLDAVTRQQLEGIMAKRRDAPYAPGRRSPSWRKVKVRQHGELVVGGWLPGARGRAGRIGALLVGYYDGPRLVFAGRVGSGFNDRELDRLGALLAAHATEHDPFTPPLTRAEAPGAHFVEPWLVVEVAYGEWTGDGRLRHPSYLGQRVDKDARDVTKP